MKKESIKQELEEQNNGPEDKPIIQLENDLSEKSSEFDELLMNNLSIEKLDPRIYKTPVKLTFKA